MVLTNVMPAGVAHRASSDSAINILQDALQCYCRIYDVPFQNLPDTLEVDGRFYEHGVDFFLTDPTFNIRRIYLVPTLRTMSSRWMT